MTCAFSISTLLPVLHVVFASDCSVVLLAFFPELQCILMPAQSDAVYTEKPTIVKKYM